jgi:sarcosine oxidase
LEQSTGRVLFRRTGLVLSGSPEGETIRGARLSAERYGIELQNLASSEAQRQFPGFVFPETHEIAFEPGAGTLLVEDCVRAQIDEAMKFGATVRGNESVIDWSSNGHSVQVRTNLYEYTAKRLVITAGAWASECLKNLTIPLRVVRKFVGWFPCPADRFQVDQGCPTFFYELPQGTFYGFPCLDGTTLKMAEHSGGDAVDDPRSVDQTCHERDLDRLQAFLGQYLPEIKPTPVRHSACLYTMTPDHHFVIDRHPEWANVSFAAGFSGHGFKFCPVVGEALADLVQHGATNLPIQFLSHHRTALKLKSR